MAIIIKSGSTAALADVDANSNLKINLPTTQTQAGFATIQTQQDAGTYTGTKSVRTPQTSAHFRLKVGLATPIFSEMFQGASLNSAQWNSTVTTMTTATSAGFLILNAGASVASAAVARVQSYRYLTYQGNSSLAVEFLLQLGQTPVASNVCEWGLGFATSTTAPTDGVFFRLNAGGALECVLNYNGSETVTTVTSGTFAWAANTTYNCQIIMTEDAVNFIVNDNFLATILRPTAGAAPASVQAWPVLLRTYNTGVTSSAQQIKVALVSAYLGDANTGKAWAHVMAGSGAMGYQGQTGGTMGTTARAVAAGTAPTAAVPTNTTAALGTGLGGDFFSTNTLAVNTYGIISSYQNPAGSATFPAKTLYITGIRISSAVQTVLANAGAGVYVYGVAFGHTAVSLATAEAATTKAPRIVVVGTQVYVGAAVQGTQANDIFMNFSSPIVVNPGEFVQCIMKNSGTVGTAGTLAHTVFFDCYWE